MADKLMYLQNDSQNYPFCRLRLDTHLNEPTNQNSLKVPKVVKPTNKKTFTRHFGDQSNKKPIVPSLSGYV